MIRTTMALAACLVAGVGLGAAKWRGSAERFHREARLAAILDQAGQMPSGGVLVIGDSTAERNRFSTLCGLPALNAGIAWSTPHDWLADAPTVVKAARPSIVVLALGSNRSDGWARDYRELVKLTGARIGVLPKDREAAKAIAGILPAAAGATSYRDDKHPDTKGAEEWRKSIDRACRAQGIGAEK